MISVDGLRTAGGLIILSIAHSLLHARPSGMHHEAAGAIAQENPGIYPLAMPLLAGPGAIATVIVFAHGVRGASGYSGLLGVVLVMAALLFLGLRLAVPASRLLGTAGMNVVTRVMGIVLAAIAVEMVFAGARVGGGLRRTSRNRRSSGGSADRRSSASRSVSRLGMASAPTDVLPWASMDTRWRLLLVASMALASSASAASVPTSCATAVSHWSAPIVVSDAVLQQSRRARRGVGAAFDIAIEPGPGLAGNPAALASWDRAAAEWEAIIADPVTVTIDADLLLLDEPDVLGQTNAVLLTGSVAEIRNPMADSALTEADEGITAALPTPGQLVLRLPAGAFPLGLMTATKANMKALGFEDLDARFGARDATIVFNSAFTFDFDRTDGSTPGTIDFQSVAAHELGHALGFFSEVDSLDQGSPLAAPTPLDLFRFADGSADDPTSTAEFTAAGRSLRPGSPDVFDDLTAEHRMSTGFSRGDGRQASHWKDDALTGVYIGLMDPTRSPRTILELTAADARALDVIGWDIATGGTATSSTTSTTSTTLPPECFEDATCADADPCTRDVCAFPVCVHAPVLGPGDVRVLVPVVRSLGGCTTALVPRSLEKRARRLGSVLERADRTRKPNRERRLLDRAGSKVERVMRKAVALAGDGRLDAPCLDALETRMDEVRVALACLRDEP
jgi:hypothetical protein